jgi:branched-chain amino acid transport system ATP-binding protein
MPCSKKAQMLRANDLHKRFGGVVALQGLNLEVPQGKIVGIIGPNGSGKTTFFNIITGLLKPDSGSVWFKGENITALKPFEICRKGIARTFQLVKPFSKLSVMQNVLVGVLFGRTERIDMEAAVKEAEYILDLLELSARKHEVVEYLSFFEKRKVELARAIASKPELLLLDEPLAGLTSAETDAILNLVKLLNRKGVTVLIIEHTLGALIDIADTIIVFNSGQKFAEGSPKAILADARVASIYFGEARI